jgi:uncharacterized protein
MRPKKTRIVSCQSSERLFKPVCKTDEELESVILTLDEFEVLRLTHLEELDQTKIADQMGIHQSTISRILGSAHKKISDALVNVKAIKIEVGCCQIKEKNNEQK